MYIEGMRWNENKLQSLPKQNLEIITCTVYAYVFEGPGTFLQDHNQLCIPSNCKKKKKKEKKERTLTKTNLVI